MYMYMYMYIYAHVCTLESLCVPRWRPRKLPYVSYEVLQIPPCIQNPESPYTPRSKPPKPFKS